MSRVQEFSIRGVRTFWKDKNCNSCDECANLRRKNFAYTCTARNKSTLNDRRFPYDNTKCKEFKPNEEAT